MGFPEMCYTNEGLWAADRSYRGSSWRPRASCVRWQQVHADNGKQPLGPIKDPAGTQSEESNELVACHSWEEQQQGAQDK